MKEPRKDKPFSEIWGCETVEQVKAPHDGGVYTEFHINGAFIEILYAHTCPENFCRCVYLLASTCYINIFLPSVGPEDGSVGQSLDVSNSFYPD